MSALVYLAQPIDLARAATIVPSTRAIEQLKNEDVWVYDPSKAYDCRNAKLDGRLQAINNRALEEADAVLALLPAVSTSVGVPVEIARAAALGKPVFVWRDQRSWVLASFPSVYVFPELETAVTALVAWVNHGDRVLDHPSVSSYNHLSVFPVYAGSGRAPTRAYEDDAGWDFFADRDYTIRPGGFATVHSQTSVEWPPGYWGLLIGRSSTFSRGLLVATTIIDPGYRGELFAQVYNLFRDDANEIGAGDRIAQIVPMPTVGSTWGAQMEQVERLSETARGTNGVGSSGR